MRARGDVILVTISNLHISNLQLAQLAIISRYRAAGCLANG